MLRSPSHRLPGSSALRDLRPFAAAILTTASISIQAQVLITAVPIVDRDTTWLRANGVPNAQFGVNVLKLTYTTPAVDGSPSVASAALVVPQTSCARPLLCYIHGTTFLRSEVPSNWIEGAGEVKQGYDYGGAGFACVLPDLLGLGDSPGLHPYLLAASEATACMDAVRAAREFTIQQGDTLDDQLFLVGASAGAHACLATAQAMQTHFPDEFHITAAAGIDGPYAMFPVIKDEMISNEPLSGGADLVYILMAYNMAYPSLFDSISDFLVAPYDTELPPLYDGYHDEADIDTLLPEVPSTMIPATLLSSIASDPEAPLNLRLKENTVYNWAPAFPLKMYYCGGGDFVPPQNSVLALTTFLANGATQVSTIEPSQTADHGECGELSHPLVFDWILSLKADCNGNLGIHGPDATTTPLTLAPDPVASGDVTLGPGTLQPNGDPVPITVFDAAGHVVYSEARQPNEQGQIRLNTDALAAGTYTVQVGSPGAVRRAKLVVVR